MTSLQRKMTRASMRKNGLDVTSDKPQPTVVEETSYRTLRPTKGWLRMSYRRIAAQQRMGALLDNVLPQRRKRDRSSPHAGINRHTGQPHEHKREIARRLNL